MQEKNLQLENTFNNAYLLITLGHDDYGLETVVSVLF